MSWWMHFHSMQRSGMGMKGRDRISTAVSPWIPHGLLYYNRDDTRCRFTLASLQT